MDDFRTFYRKRNGLEDSDNWLARPWDGDISVKLRFFETAADYMDALGRLEEPAPHPLAHLSYQQPVPAKTFTMPMNESRYLEFMESLNSSYETIINGVNVRWMSSIETENGMRDVTVMELFGADKR